MSLGLVPYVCPYDFNTAWTHRVDIVTFGPPKRVPCSGPPFSIHYHRTATLEALHQAWNHSGGMQLNKKMYMCSDDAKFEDVGPFLASDGREQWAEYRCGVRIDDRSPTFRCPSHVHVKTMAHPMIYRSTDAMLSPFVRRPYPFVATQ